MNRQFLSAITDNIIQIFARDTISKSSLIARGRNRQLTREDFIAFLSNMYYLLQHNERTLRDALSLSEASYPEFAAFYRTKVKEETDHARWAKDDLKLLGVTEIPESTVIDECRAIMALNRRQLAESPLMYLAHVIVLESLTIIVCPALLEDSKACGLPPERFTVLSKHVIADEHHAMENYEFLDSLNLTEPQQTRFLASIQESLLAVHHFLNGVCAYATSTIENTL